MDFCQTRARLVQAGVAFAATALVAGCGSAYRPVVTPITTSGPAAQPTSYAVVVSAPSPTTAGIATILDYSGDSVMAQAPIGPGPLTFSLDESGTTGYTVNSDGTLTNFPATSTLQAKQVNYSTLPTSALPVNLFSPSTGLWIADLNGNVADVLTGSPEAFKLAVPAAPAPVMIAGPGTTGQRNYAISQNIASPTGVECNLSPTTASVGAATPIEISSYSPDTSITVGKCPVYAVQSGDNKRLFVLNRGDDTITVINSQNNTPDKCTSFTNLAGQKVTCHPTLPLSTNAVTATGITPPNGTSGMGTTAGPVYAEYNVATQQLVVANYDGGTISIIDVSLDEFGNDYNTYDSNGKVTGGFGTTYTVQVGQTSAPYPASVTVLYDGSRAYTANQGEGTVSIVNLASHTLEKTLAVVGHPRTVVSTQNSQFGKVYAASPDSPYLTILSTTTDIVDTTVLVEGNIVDVRVSTQNGTGNNNNSNSRRPGYGQPCNLPPALMQSTYGSSYTLDNCTTLP
jgi:DNA-binding beta-propeller fold protein YncE